MTTLAARAPTGQRMTRRSNTRERERPDHQEHLEDGRQRLGKLDRLALARTRPGGKARRAGGDPQDDDGCVADGTEEVEEARGREIVQNGTSVRFGPLHSSPAQQTQVAVLQDF